MATLTKNHKKALEAVDREKYYALEEASALIKKVSYVKFNESVELHVRLGVDPRQANQIVPGVGTKPPRSG